MHAPIITAAMFLSHTIFHLFYPKHAGFCCCCCCFFVCENVARCIAGKYKKQSLFTESLRNLVEPSPKLLFLILPKVDYLKISLLFAKYLQEVAKLDGMMQFMTLPG